jgi:3'-phosphoadenosine 5'-phosphosulfate sulfotransferase (PAPS reductase)/FAD synthetase
MKINLPAEVHAALIEGAALVVSISGGKDSQAMFESVVALWREHRFTGDIVAVHADLGRIEWHESLEHCRAQAARLGVELHVVKANQSNGDMLERWRDRRAKLDAEGRTDEPHWSSSKARYCTSDMKRNPIDTFLRRYALVVSCEGVAAYESPARALKPALEVRKQITAAALKRLSPAQALAARKSGERLAFNWRPVHDWSLADVWQACGTSVEDVDRRRELFRAGFEGEALAGFTAHAAYVYGNERVSCVVCILASVNDIKVAARMRPDIVAELIAQEHATGFTFKHNRSLEQIINS